VGPRNRVLDGSLDHHGKGDVRRGNVPTAHYDMYMYLLMSELHIVRLPLWANDAAFCHITLYACFILVLYGASQHR